MKPKHFLDEVDGIMRKYKLASEENAAKAFKGNSFVYSQSRIAIIAIGNRNGEAFANSYFTCYH